MMTDRMKLELEAARFQHREKDLQATARHENKRAEKAEVQCSDEFAINDAV